MMKFIAAMLFILIASLVVLGTVVVTYANSPKPAVVVTPTPLATIQPTVETQITPSAQPNAHQSDTAIFQGNSNLPEIALTFDDGPYPNYTQQVLSILRQYGIHATFFTIGENVQNYPDLVQQEYTGGNVVGNHTWSHPDLTRLSANKIHMQLTDASNAIQQAIGEQPTFFRPPYGAIDDEVKIQAAQLGLTPTLWNIDTQDWQRPGTRAIINAVLSQVGNGSIILMHDGGGDRSQTVAALPTIIKTLLQRGYQFVTIQQLAEHLQQTWHPTHAAT